MSDTYTPEEAIESLRHLVACRCDEAYTLRGRHDPYSACDYAEEVDVVAEIVTTYVGLRDRLKDIARTLDSESSVAFSVSREHEPRSRVRLLLQSNSIAKKAAAYRIRLALAAFS